MKRLAERAATAALSLLLLSSAVYTWGPRTLCEGFLPENDLKIPEGDVNAAGIEETIFNSVLDKIDAIYGPIIASKGGKLVINRKWSDGTVNASAMQFWGSWYINMYGGLARHQAISEEGFALVACHEIGHHLGGYPKSRGWATNEGGADYFATLKCLRKVLGKSAPGGGVDPVADAGCSGQFADEASRNLCRNGANAGSSVAGLFQALRPGPQPPGFGTPDPSVVDKMFDAHPAPQCRLDTYFQGAICPKSDGEEVANDDPNPGACTAKQKFQVGLRPRCWYKPPADEPTPVGPPPALVERPELKDGEGVQRKLEALKTALSGRGV